MWDARFSKAENSRVNDFNSSISFDSRMFREDIEGSMAHATMLGRCGIISPDESAKIVTALAEIRADIESGALAIDPEAEDFGMAAMKYALSLGVNTLIPPGNFASFSFVVDHIDHCLANPINDADKALLLQKLETVRGKEFFDWKI